MIEVILESKGDVKVKYKIGSSEEQEILLNPNQFHTFRTKSALELGISDGGLVRVYLNGKDRGLSGPSGKPSRLKYPK